MTYRYVVQWNIPNAGDAVSVFHLGSGGGYSPAATVNAIRAAFEACKTRIPNEVTLTFPPEYAEIDNRSGQTIGFGAIASPAPVVGSGSSEWAAGVGARLVWQTDTVARGRRVRGATFMVPLVLTSFTNTGLVAETTRTLLTDAWTTALGAASASNVAIGVYSRPSSSGAGDGFWSPALTVGVPPLTATLRGRKY